MGTGGRTALGCHPQFWGHNVLTLVCHWQRWDPLSKMKCSGLVQSVEKVVESLGHHNPYNLSSRHKH